MRKKAGLLSRIIKKAGFMVVDHETIPIEYIDFDNFKEKLVLCKSYDGINWFTGTFINDQLIESYWKEEK